MNFTVLPLHGEGAQASPSFSIVETNLESLSRFEPYQKGSYLHTTGEIKVEFKDIYEPFAVHVLTKSDYYKPDNDPKYPEGYPETIGLFLLDDSNEVVIKEDQVVAYESIDGDLQPVKMTKPMAIPLRYIAYDYPRPLNAGGFIWITRANVLGADGKPFDPSNSKSYNLVFEDSQIKRKPNKVPELDENGQLQTLETGAAYVYSDGDGTDGKGAYGTVTFKFAVDIENMEPGKYQREVFLVCDFEDPE